MDFMKFFKSEIYEILLMKFTKFFRMKFMKFFFNDYFY